jgi:hypothetical protein
MADLLNKMIAVIGKSIEVQTDISLFRGSADISVIYGSYAKTNRLCGWVPEISLGRSVLKMFEE